MNSFEIIGSGRLKDKILLILSVDYPLTAKKIFYRLKRSFQISVTYQAVYKAITEMVQSGVLIVEEKEYQINLDWINRLGNFSEKVRENYTKRQVPIQNIRVISFDMDGCLSDNAFDEIVWSTEIPKIYAKEHSVSFEKAYREVTKEYDRMWGKVEDWRDIEFWFKHFGFKTNWQGTITNLKQHIRRYGDVLPVLKELSKHFKLVILSHADRKFLDLKIKVNKLEKYIYKSFSTTTDFKEYSKSKWVFLEVCKKLKIKPQQIIHIGDSYEYDYEIPSSIGIKCFFIDRKGTKTADYIVRDLTEFKNKVLG